MKWNYLYVAFSRNAQVCKDVSKIILVDEDNVRVSIKETEIGVSCKNCLLIIPAHPLKSDKNYTLFIPQSTLQAEDGEFYDKDITVQFKTKP